MSKPSFGEKTKQNVVRLSTAAFAQRMVKFNYYPGMLFCCQDIVCYLSWKLQKCTLKHYDMVARPFLLGCADSSIAI